MMFKRLSVLTMFVLLGTSFLLSAQTAQAQRGGFGGGGFGRGGFGRGGFGRGGFGGTHGTGHTGSASVTVVSGNFVPSFSRLSRDGNAHVNPFFGKIITRFPSVFVHAAPFGFVSTVGFVGITPFDSSLGLPIPQLVTLVPTSPFFFGFPIESRPVFRTVVDLGTITPVRPIAVDCARTSNVTIVNLPANAFRGAHQ